MRTGPTRQAKLRRRRRIRFAVEVASAAAFGLLIVAVVIVLAHFADKPRKAAAVPPPPAPQRSAGSIMEVDPDGCVVSAFDNRNGELGSPHEVPCPSNQRPHNQMPLNRFKRFNQGFQK